MQLQTRTKLYPPMALLWQGPMPGPSAAAPGGSESRISRPSSNLSVNELRRIVSEMLG